MTAFFVGCLALFNDTLNAMWDVPTFRFFLLCFVFAAIVGLCMLLFHAAKGVAS